MASIFLLDSMDPLWRFLYLKYYKTLANLLAWFFILGVGTQYIYATDQNGGNPFSPYQIDHNSGSLQVTSNSDITGDYLYDTGEVRI